MHRVILAKDLEVPRIVPGLMRLRDWNMSAEERLRFLENCLELGLDAFDLADIYGDYEGEALFGETLAKRPGLRNRIRIITKCGIRLKSDKFPEVRVKHYDTSRDHLIRSVHRSLKMLGTDRIDLLLIHRPDPLMDPAEVAEAFRRLHQEGSVLHFGVSNFTPPQFDLLQSFLPFPLVTNQIEISIMHPEPFYDGTLNHLMARKIPPMAWSPLAGGLVFKEDCERALRIRNAARRIAAETGASSMETVLLAWLIRHPYRIIPVVGTGRIEKIRAAAEAAEIGLDRQHWFELLEASAGREVD